MNETTVNDLCRSLTGQWWGPGARPRREPVRVWEMSGVERLHPYPAVPPRDRSVIFKYARAPFTGEHHVLAYAAEHRLPVPAVLAVTERPGRWGCCWKTSALHAGGRS